MEQTNTPVEQTTNKYELMVIFLPDLGEEAVKKELAELKKLLLNDGGDVYHEDVWGLKDFAYRIKKQDEGYYVILNFSLQPDKIAELENFLNIHQTILRYLIVKTPFNYELRTLKNYEVENEKLDKEEQKAKNDAAPRRGLKKKPPVQKQGQSAAQAPKAPSTSVAPNRGDKATETEAEPQRANRAAAERIDSASKASTSTKEKPEAETEETAKAPEDAEPEATPEKSKKKIEKVDLDDFDKKLKSIIDDPDISL